MENTVPFGTGKFRKLKPKFLVEWIAPFVYIVKMSSDFNYNFGFVVDEIFELGRTRKSGCFDTPRKAKQQWQLLQVQRN